MMNVLHSWLIFISVFSLTFNVGLNNSSSSKIKPWIDLNLEPHALPQQPNESINQDQDNSPEPLDESDDLDQADFSDSMKNLVDPGAAESLGGSSNNSVNLILTDQPDQVRIHETKHLSIPLPLSRDDLETKFIRTIKRRWVELNPFSKSGMAKEVRHAFCYQIWTRLNGPLDFCCIGRVLLMGKTRSKVTYSMKMNANSVSADLLSCTCRPLSLLGKHETVFVSQYSDEEYFILLKATPYSNIYLLSFLYGVDSLHKVRDDGSYQHPKSKHKTHAEN